MSGIATIIWLLLFLLATALQAFDSDKRFRSAWFAVLYASLAIGLLVTAFVGYSAFIGDERDWGKGHDTFVLSEYISLSVSFGLFYGSIAAGCVALISSLVVAFLGLFRKVRPNVRREYEQPSPGRCLDDA